MIVCEYEVGFTHPDPDRPEYAFAEIDVFAHNPAARARGEDGLYRLSVRRQLGGPWELYRTYYNPGGAPGREHVDRVGTLAEVLAAANEAWLEAWGGLAAAQGEKDPGPHDRACDHEPGSRGRARNCAKP
ncbi:MAG TPA: hypothetical protein VMG99_08850 [Thermoplasmata archaeon]|nr:hypothetical protein [Thermoplasmata archaeon]